MYLSLYVSQMAWAASALLCEVQDILDGDFQDPNLPLEDKGDKQSERWIVGSVQTMYVCMCF